MCKYIRNLLQKRSFVGTAQRLARIRTRMRGPKARVRFASEEEIWVVILGNATLNRRRCASNSSAQKSHTDSHVLASVKY